MHQSGDYMDPALKVVNNPSYPAGSTAKDVKRTGEHQDFRFFRFRNE